MVKHAAHNGMIIGSNPITPIINAYSTIKRIFLQK